MALLDDLLKLIGVRMQKTSDSEDRSNPVQPETIPVPKRRIILLPREIDTKLDNLARIEDEVNGILIYKLQESEYEMYCPVLHLYLAGIGTAGHVQANPQRMEVANELFKRHLEYRFVKFHTHSKGTIARFGEYYNTNFSPGDIHSYEEQMAHDPDFVGMLATQRVKLLYGRDKPQLRIIDKDVPLIGRQIAEELEAIAREKGYTFEQFRSRV